MEVTLNDNFDTDVETCGVFTTITKTQYFHLQFDIN
jgi:hypothetical protein